MALASRALQRAQSLQEQTYQTLRTAILSGEFAAGERLVETQLADILQVSRTPIREALRQLQQENLVTVEAHGGTRVAKLSVQDAAQLYDCRIALEGLSVQEACRNATAVQLKALHAAVQQAEKQIMSEPHRLTSFHLLDLDYQFHRLLAESSENPWLVSLLDRVFNQMSLLRIRTMQHNPDVLEIRNEHRQIYQAIADRNIEQAIAAITSHLTASKERVICEIRQLEQQSQYADSM